MDSPVEIIEKRSRPIEMMATGIDPVLPTLPRIKAALFDVYGTLFISGAGDLGAAEDRAAGAGMRAILRRHGLVAAGGVTDAHLTEKFPSLIRDAHDRRREEGIEFPEVDIREIWRELLECLYPEGADEAIEAIATEYECRMNPVWPMPGMEELLKILGERGILLGIVSNAQFYTPWLFAALTERSLGEWGFPEDLCVWSFREREGKPSRILFERAAAALAKRGVAPAEVLYAGNDILNDVRPAAAAGFRTALFAGDRRSLRLRGWRPGMPGGPDAIVTELRQIADCIE